MKKTIALLLAMAGMAMALESPQLVVDNRDNSANETSAFESTTIDATVALYLNLGNIVKMSADAPIFTIVGPHTGGARNITVGLGIDIDGDYSYMDAWIGNTTDYQRLDMALNKSQIESAEYGIVVYTLSQNPDGGQLALSEILFLYDQDGNVLENSPTVGSFRSIYTANYKSFAEFNINKDLVYEARVYNSILVDDEPKELADQMVKSYIGGPAAPEPTTATLSLLALAGLAARRRRR